MEKPNSELKYLKDGKIIGCLVVDLERYNGKEHDKHYELEERLLIVQMVEFILEFYNQRISKLNTYEEIRKEIKEIVLPGDEFYSIADSNYSTEVDNCDRIGSLPASEWLFLNNSGIILMNNCIDYLVPFGQSIEFNLFFTYLLKNLYLDTDLVKKYLIFFHGNYGEEFLDFLDNNLLIYNKIYKNDGLVSFLRKWYISEAKNYKKKQFDYLNESTESLDAIPFGYMFLHLVNFIKNNPKGEDKTNIIRILHAIEGSKFSNVTNSKFYKVVYKGLSLKNDEEQKKILKQIIRRLEKYELNQVATIIEKELKQIPE